jgi:hypothetical protein
MKSGLSFDNEKAVVETTAQTKANPAIMPA